MSHDGHDMGSMDMGGGMSLSMGAMRMYFHFTSGDLLWFLGWVPTSAGAMVGACVGLFLLGVLERWIAAVKNVAEVRWKARVEAMALSRERMRAAAQRDSFASGDGAGAGSEDVKVASMPIVPPTPRIESQHHTKTSGIPGTLSVLRLKSGATAAHRAPPFVWKHDALRGLMHATHVALGYVLMLAVMTFNVGFIFSICAGAGVGEMLFGRFVAHQAFH